jgi:TRAP-type C4-dicarboxylate transport system permease small subunit
MVTVIHLFPRRFRKAVIVLSSLLSAGLFVLVDVFLIQAIYDEISLFHAVSGALGIPVWIYYLGVPVLSVYVFRGIYRDAMSKLRALEKEAER